MTARRVDIADPNVRDIELCRRSDIADWLGVTLQGFDWMRANGKAPEPCTPDGVRPRWRVGDVRGFYSARKASDAKPAVDKNCV